MIVCGITNDNHYLQQCIYCTILQFTRHCRPMSQFTIDQSVATSVPACRNNTLRTEKKHTKK